MLEQLLRLVPGVRRIYVIVRSRPGVPGGAPPSSPHVILTMAHPFSMLQQNHPGLGCTPSKLQDRACTLGEQIDQFRPPWASLKSPGLTHGVPLSVFRY